MKNTVLVVDINHNDHSDKIKIFHAERIGEDVSPVENVHDHEHSEVNLIYDMDVLCEALVALIHAGEQEGIMNSSQSLKRCFQRITDGFADPMYFANING